MNRIAVIEDRIVKTRTSHRCWGCTKSFPSGKLMRYMKQVGEDGWWQGYFCRPCSVSWDNIDWSDMDEGVTEGTLDEDSDYPMYLREFPEFGQSTAKMERMLIPDKLFKHALEVFGTEKKVMDYMKSRPRSLGGKSPLEYIKEGNWKEIDNELGRIEWGVF